MMAAWAIANGVFGMCGIVGFTSLNEGGAEIFNALKELEYRGYDSSGIAVVDEEKNLKHVKKAGHLSNIECLAKTLRGTCGLGHTRWATHGVPTDLNAHPHINKRLALVHNGIVENFLDLNQYVSKCSSETDTEIILKLIELEMEKGRDTLQAIGTVAEQIKGSFAIVLIDKECPGKVFGARRGLSLIMGKGDQRAFLASDAAAFPDDCKEISIIEDQSLVQVSNDQQKCQDFSGNMRPLKFSHYYKVNETSHKNGHDHFMIKEIKEQPKILEKLVRERLDCETISIHDLAGVQGLNLGKIDHIQIIGCGSSYFAGLIGKYYLEKYTHLPVTVELSSEFRYGNRPLSPKSLLVALSQSGETADTLACVIEARKAKCQILSFCNRINSEIPRLSTKTISLCCGPEISVASTKVFTAMILSLFLFSLSYSRHRDLLKSVDLSQKIKQLIRLPELMKKVLEEEKRIKGISKILCKKTLTFFMGRRNNYPIALEGALKLKEVSYIYSEGHAGGELKHGPLALIEEDCPVIAIAPLDQFFPKILSNIIETKSRKAKLITITDDQSKLIMENSWKTILIPSIDEDLSPILTSAAIQLLAYHTAKYKGTNIDQPRNIAKSVTVE